MYVGFSTITRRKMFLYVEDDYRYLMRSYFRHGVDKNHQDNTYM